MKKYERKLVDIGNGESLAYYETGKGDKKLLLVHGNMSSSIHWVPLVEQLEEDYHIYAVDMRGFGESTYNRKYYDLHEAADDIALFCNKIGLSDFAVAGWSTGGAVSMSLTARYPNLKINKLFLVDSVSVKGFQVFHKNAKGKAIMGDIYANKEEMANDPVQTKPSREYIETKNFEAMDRLWKIAIYTKDTCPSEEDNKIFIEESFKQRSNDENYWSLSIYNISNEKSYYTSGSGLVNNINVPIHCIYGTNDRVVVPYMNEEIVRIFTELKKDFHFHSIEGGGHSPFAGNSLVQLVKVFKENK